MEPLIVLTGPTAVGKSKLAVRLAKEINGEIISADSMQVYRGMDIGTDKIPLTEREGVPHHLIDVLEPTEPFNVRRFQQMALEAVREIRARHHVPLLAGGTGFYIRSVLYNTDFTETDDNPGIRHSYEDYVKKEGASAVDALHEKLSALDPESAESIPKQNVRRVIRALEFYEKTGTPISAHNKRERAKESPFAFCYFVLTDDRKRLYERIDARVDQMIEYGLVGEVERLIRQGVTGEMTSMQGLGYREVFAHLNGAYDLPRAVFLIKRNTRHFAKRQLTWFKGEREVIMADKRDFSHDDSAILSYMTECLRTKGIV